MLDPAPTTITTSTLAGWLATAATAVVVAMWGALRWFLVKMDRRFDEHIREAKDRDKAIAALQVQAEGFNRQHGETGRVLERLERHVEQLNEKIDEMPERLALRLARGRS